MTMREGWTTIDVTSPEGWHEVHVLCPDGAVSRYVETPEVDEQGRVVFEYAGRVPQPGE